MFTRTELKIKTIQELKQLCQRYAVKPTGNAGYKVSYITTLMAFPRIALSQMEQGRGLKAPSFADLETLGKNDRGNGISTDEQAALIKITLEGRAMEYPERWQQERLHNLHKAKMLLERAFGLLAQH